MLLTDPNLSDNPIVFVNRAFRDLTGYEEHEMVGRNCRFLQGVDTDSETVTVLQEAVAKCRPDGVEMLNYKRDGTAFWNSVHISPIYDRQGNLMYFCSSQLDVTARREVEKAFQKAHELEALGQLSAGLAHDFNNLLQVVMGNLELLRTRLVGDYLRRHVDNAAAAANRVATLTAQLLAFGRRLPLEPKAIDLGVFIHGRWPLLRAAVGGQITLRFNPGRRVPLTIIDPLHLELALIHLLNNARDAMPNGGTIAITASAMPGTDSARSPDRVSGDYVALSISDEGEGMSPAVLDRAPEPFFSTKTIGKGSGLGLSMVHGFVRQSLGRLEIDSERGYGTTVRMIFPTVRHLMHLDTPDAGDPGELAEVQNLKEKRTIATILVVEDNDDVLARASACLGALGYRVLSARNGGEALEVVAREASRGIDLLFTDIFMPGGVNGVVLANKVVERFPDLPVLFTSGRMADAPAGKKAAIDILDKPYRCSELARRVRAALDRKPAGAASYALG